MWLEPEVVRRAIALQVPVTKLRPRVVDAYLSTEAKLPEHDRWTAALAAVRQSFRPASDPVAHAPKTEVGARSGGAQVYREVVANLVSAYRFDQPWHSELLALYVLQSAMTAVLSRVFHVYLSGPPGSGKSGLGRRVVDLCSGSLFGDVSTAALARTTSHGKTIGIDEADAVRGGGEDARQARDALVRDAYRADSPAYVRYNNKSGKNETFATFGPRVLMTREDLDSATAQRGVPIGCVAPSGDDETYGLLLEGIWPSGVQDLAGKVALWGKERIAGVAPRNLQGLATEPAFMARVKETVGTTAACRETELAVVMLLVVQMAGLDYAEVSPHLTAALTAGLVSSAAGDDQLAGDAMDALRDILPKATLDEGDTTRVRRKPWLDVLNHRRRSRGEPPVNTRAFGRVLRDVGVRETWKVGTGGVVSFDLPAAAVDAARAGANSLRTPHTAPPPEVPHLPHSPNSAVGAVGQSDTVPNSTVSDGESGVSGVSGVEERNGWDSHSPSRSDRVRARLEEGGEL